MNRCIPLALPLYLLFVSGITDLLAVTVTFVVNFKK